MSVNNSIDANIEIQALHKKIENLEQDLKDFKIMKENFQLVFSTVEMVHLKLGLKVGDWNDIIKEVRKWARGNTLG